MSSQPPPEEVLAAFGVAGCTVARLAGGQGSRGTSAIASPGGELPAKGDPFGATTHKF